MNILDRIECFIIAVLIVCFLFPLYHDHQGKLCFGNWKDGWCVHEGENK